MYFRVELLMSPKYSSSHIFIDIWNDCLCGSQLSLICKQAHNLHYFSTMGTSPCLAQVSKFLFIILPWLALSPHSSKVMGLNSFILSVCRSHVLSACVDSLQVFWLSPRIQRHTMAMLSYLLVWNQPCLLNMVTVGSKIKNASAQTSGWPQSDGVCLWANHTCT